jgi:hypothetical protein
MSVGHKECSHRASGPAEEGWLAFSLDARTARCEGKYHASGNVWRTRTVKWEICPRDECGQSRSTAKLCPDLPERPAAQRSLWTGSAAVAQLARRWLRDCLDGHQTCLRESWDRSDVSRAGGQMHLMPTAGPKTRVQPDPFDAGLPTRLLYVPSKESIESPHLLTTAQLD